MLSINRQTIYLLIVLSVGQVLLISAQVQSKAGMPLLEAIAVGMFGSVQRSTAWVAGGGHNVWSHYLALRGAAIENDALRQRVVELEGAFQGQQAAVSRTQALEAALGLKQSALVETLTARVISGSASTDSMTVTIDRGVDDGVLPDMAVIAAQGVVGRVIGHPTKRTATVQLLISRTASAAVKFERTGMGAGNTVGIAGDPPLRLDQLPNLVDVKAGDRVLTSGLDGIFPQGFVVGTVERVDLANAARRMVTVRPAVEFTDLDIVLVVVGRSAAGSDR